MKKDKANITEEEVFNLIGYNDRYDYEENRLKPLKETYVKIDHVRRLQDKAVLEGLTDEEKKEYKELRNIK